MTTRSHLHDTLKDFLTAERSTPSRCISDALVFEKYRDSRMQNLTGEKREHFLEVVLQRWDEKAQIDGLVALVPHLSRESSFKA